MIYTKLVMKSPFIKRKKINKHLKMYTYFVGGFQKGAKPPLRVKLFWVLTQKSVASYAFFEKGENHG